VITSLCAAWRVQCMRCPSCERRPDGVEAIESSVRAIELSVRCRTSARLQPAMRWQVQWIGAGTGVLRRAEPSVSRASSTVRTASWFARRWLATGCTKGWSRPARSRKWCRPRRSSPDSLLLAVVDCANVSLRVPRRRAAHGRVETFTQRPEADFWILSWRTFTDATEQTSPIVTTCTTRAATGVPAAL